MKKASIAYLRSQLSSLLDYVQKGEELQIEKRNVAIAKLVPVKTFRQNFTKLGRGKNSVKFLKDVVGPAFEEDWEMLK